MLRYDNVPVVTPDGRRSHVERRINEAEAAVVRRIFALCAQGFGMRSIARRLNAEGALSPRPQRGRPKGWAPSSLHAVIYRRLYATGANHLSQVRLSANFTKGNGFELQLRASPERRADSLRARTPDASLTSILEWANFMRSREVSRVCCLLDDGQLAGFPVNLEAEYKKLFGAARFNSMVPMLATTDIPCDLSLLPGAAGF